MHYFVDESKFKKCQIVDDKFTYKLYLYRTSFGKNYAHFSFLFKQMDILLAKFYIFRKVT